MRRFDQLKRTDAPKLFYALAVRLNDSWGSVLVIGRVTLQELMEAGCGSKIENSKTRKLDLKLYIQFHHEEGGVQVGPDGRPLKARCGEFDMTEYLNAWESLPPLKPPGPFVQPEDV